MRTLLNTLRPFLRSYLWVPIALCISILPFFIKEGSPQAQPLLELPAEQILFHPGHNKTWAAPDLDTSNWKPVTLPHNWWQQGYPKMNANGWYRIPFNLDDSYQTQSLVLSLGYIGSLSQIYLNGHRIGGEGRFFPTSLPPQRTLHSAVLPAHLLHYGSTTNHLAVRVKSFVGAGGLLSDTLSLYSSNIFWDVKEQAEYTRETWKIIVFSVCLVAFSLFTIISFLVQARYKLTYRAAAWLTYSCGFGVFYNSHLFQNSDGMSPSVILIYFLMTLIMPTAYYALALSVSGLKRHQPVTCIAGLAITGYSIVAIIYHQHVIWSALAYGAMWFLITLIALVILLIGVYKKEPNARAVLLGLFIFSSFSSLELLSFSFGWLEYATLFWGPVEVGVIGFVTTMSWVLLSQYIRLHRREQTLRQRMLNIQDDERRRIGHNLHDSVAQDLIGLQYELKLLKAKPGASNTDSVHSLTEYTQEILTEVRGLAEDFQPFNKRNHSLTQAIENWQAQLSKRFPCTFENTLQTLPLSPTIEEAIYRITQEATQNACRHGRADRIKIKLYESDKHHVRLRIEDNGRGFDISHMNQKRLGVNFMKDRAEACGGHLTLSSEPGRGTTIEAWLPKHTETPETSV